MLDQSLGIAFLLTGGSPATIDELKERFDQHLALATKRKDLSKVRIVLE
jgi:hypothetical protein